MLLRIGIGVCSRRSKANQTYNVLKANPTYALAVGIVFERLSSVQLFYCSAVGSSRDRPSDTVRIAAPPPTEEELFGF